MIDLPKPEVYQDTDTNFTKFWNIRNVLYNVVQILKEYEKLKKDYEYITASPKDDEDGWEF